jgi:hypothetical protein
MIKNCLLLGFFSIISICNAQIPIHFIGKGFNYVLNEKLLTDILYLQPITDTTYIKLYVKDEKGKSSIQLIHENGAVLEEGDYQSSIDLLSHYIIGDGDVREDLEIASFSKIYIKYYYLPLKDGKWVYRDIYGQELKTELWINGVCSCENSYMKTYSAITWDFSPKDVKSIRINSKEDLQELLDRD